MLPINQTRSLRSLLPLLALFFVLASVAPASAQCVNGTPCDDGNACTTNDFCFNDTCIGAPVSCSDDGNTCTTETCDPVQGCQSMPNTDPCSDGDICTTGDVCSGGTCQPGPGQLLCDDGNDCTIDSCLPTAGCNFATVVDGTTCDDASACTDGDACTGGLCTGAAVTCPGDANPCTTATCDPATGCLQIANSAACDDANPCTLGDICSGGTCISGSPVDCSDNNDCTDDICSPADGSCSNIPNNATCSDNNGCTQNDVCVGGLCQPGPPLDCGVPTNSCLVGLCDAILGCTTVPAANGTSCSDQDLCTSEDVCSNGVCEGTAIPGCSTPNIPSTSDWGRHLLVVILCVIALLALKTKQPPREEPS